MFRRVVALLHFRVMSIYCGARNPLHFASISSLDNRCVGVCHAARPYPREGYQCGDPEGTDPLPIPIAAIGAVGDNRYKPEQLSQWARHCSSRGRDGGAALALGQSSAQERGEGEVESESVGGGGGGESGGGGGGFSEHWFTGVDPNNTKTYWGTPHRIVLDYPKELQAYLATDLPTLY